jgi:signal transduction histidine kinase/integral membrane sensor domain MASE1
MSPVGVVSSPLRRWSLVAAIGAVYVVAAKLGLAFAFLHPSATAVWPPAGIALAALLLFGVEMWPAVFAGAFLVNATTAGSVATSLGIALGNTLEAVIAARLIARLATGRHAFAHPLHIFTFTILAALAAVVSATVGVTSLALGGYAPWNQFGSVWLTWWLGNIAGDLTVAPLILLWADAGWRELRHRWAEAALLLIGAALVGTIVFGGILPGSLANDPLAFLCIPMLMWAAFRFGPAEAATTIALVSAIAVTGTIRGYGPFVGTTPNASLLLLQGFMTTIAVTILPVAALVRERRAIAEERATLLVREQGARTVAEGRQRVSEELARVARSLAATLDVTAVGERIVETVLPLFNARAAGLRLLAPDGALVGVAFAGGMRQAFPPGHVLPPGPTSVSACAIAAGAPAWSEDVFADPRLSLAADVREGMAGAGDAAVLAVPLRTKGETIGALSIADRRGRRFTAAEAEMLQAFADHAAVAVENARLYQDATRQRHESDVIAALAAEISGALDLDHVLLRVTEAAASLCEGDFARTAFREPGAETMTFRFAVGTRGSVADYAHVRVLAGKGLGGLVMTTGQPYRTADVAHDPHLHPDYRWMAEAEGSRAVMVVPIRAEGRVEGLIYVNRRTSRPFTERDEQVCLRLADQASIAIRNSRLFAAERAARAEADAANRAKDQFLAMLSHELRTPLNAIMGWARMLRNPRLDEARKTHAMEVIERNTRLQAQLINDLLDVSRIIAGKLELERYPVDLVPIIQEAVEALRGDVEAKALTLTMATDAATGEVLGDPLRLNQVVVNLLSNAIKFTPRGGRIEVGLARQGGYARLSVRDSGEGIEPALLPNIFEPFQQADSSSSRVHQGLGLGLAIVRQLVEFQGGTVHAESAGKGQGATFVVDLPIVALRWPGGLTRGTERRGEPAGARPRLDGRRVLVVDDHADARELVGLVLREHGARVTLAASTAEALEFLARDEFDVLVSDLAMPEADGYALIAAVRAMTEASQRPRPWAVALTAYTNTDTRERVLAAGFDSHATKPIDPEELIELIAKLPPA